MNTKQNQQVVQQFWSLIDAFRFNELAPLLHDDYICEWPQSKERIRGRDNFIAINTNYPGQWRVAQLNIFPSHEQVISTVLLRYQEQAIYATSFFTLQDGKIVRQVEYWADTYQAPEWRAQWVEPIA